MRWTKEDLAAYMTRIEAEAPDTPDEGRESRLQAKCLKWCKDHGYPVFHDWSRKRNSAGWPDLFLFAPGGRVILVELKAAGGRLSDDQKTLRHMLKWHGHEVFVVRSYRRFIEIVSESQNKADEQPKA